MYNYCFNLVSADHGPLILLVFWFNYDIYDTGRKRQTISLFPIRSKGRRDWPAYRLINIEGEINTHIHYFNRILCVTLCTQEYHYGEIF